MVYGSSFKILNRRVGMVEFINDFQCKKFQKKTQKEFKRIVSDKNPVSENSCLELLLTLLWFREDAMLLQAVCMCSK